MLQINVQKYSLCPFVLCFFVSGSIHVSLLCNAVFICLCTTTFPLRKLLLFEGQLTHIISCTSHCTAPISIHTKINSIDEIVFLILQEFFRYAPNCFDVTGFR